MVTNSNINNEVKTAYNEAQAEAYEQKANEVLDVVNNFLKIPETQRQTSCAAACYFLLDGSAHLAEDEAFAMQDTTMDLIMFLADPEIAAAFVKKFNNSYYLKHLRRLHDFFTEFRNNPRPIAEMASYELRDFEVSPVVLDGLLNRFSTPSNND